MEKAVLLSQAYGWFIGLLIVMIVVTGLFGFILWIALKPIKKDELADSVSPASKALARRESELTIALLKLRDKTRDQSKLNELENKLREVKAAEKLVAELLGEDDPARKAAAKPAAKPVKNAKPAPEAPVKPAAGPAVEPKKEQTAKPAVEPKKEPEAKPAVEPKKEPAAAPAQTAPKASVKPAAAPAKKPEQNTK